jgi:hypothetical protein
VIETQSAVDSNAIRTSSRHRELEGGLTTKSPWRANVWIKDPTCCERGSPQISISRLRIATTSYPLSRDISIDTSFVCFLRLNRCDFKGLYLCSSLYESSCSGRLVDSAASYCTVGIAPRPVHASTRGDEAGACASVAAMIHCPQTCPSYFTDRAPVATCMWVSPRRPVN